MATLSADKSRVYSTDINEFGELPVIASDIIYEGAATGESSSAGTFRPLQGGDNFGGFAVEKADNSSGAASAINVRVRRRGYVWLATITGASGIADAESTVYATDDDTFTLTASGASAIGKIVTYNSSDGFFVYFEADSVRSI